MKNLDNEKMTEKITHIGFKFFICCKYFLFKVFWHNEPKK